MITEKDEELLSILRCNARASVSDIARATGVSRTAIQNRLTKLENSGVIKAYSIVLGSEYSNQLISANVSLKPTRVDQCGPLISWLWFNSASLMHKSESVVAQRGASWLS